LSTKVVASTGLFAGTIINNAPSITITALITVEFKFRHIAQTTPTGRLLSLAANANVLTAVPMSGIAIRNVTQLLKVTDTSGKSVRGKFYVETVTSDFSFKLAHWPGQVVGPSGKIRLLQFGFTAIAPIPENGIGNDPTIRPGTRKCGRPFGQLRGRAVARA